MFQINKSFHRYRPNGAAVESCCGGGGGDFSYFTIQEDSYYSILETDLHWFHVTGDGIGH